MNNNNEYNKSSENFDANKNKVGGINSGATSSSTLGGKTGADLNKSGSINKDQTRSTQGVDANKKADASWNKNDREGLAINPKGAGSKEFNADEDQDDDLALNSQMDKNKKVDPSVANKGAKTPTTNNSNYRA